MQRIAVIADSHFDEGSRFDETVRLHDWIADDLASRNISAIMHAGDIYERKSTPAERAAVARWLARCAEQAPVLVVRGNHDALGDLPLLTRLRSRHPILVEEACGVHRVGGVTVAALAWPRKAELLAAQGRPVSHEESAQFAADAMTNVLRGLGAEMAEHSGPRVLLAHAMVSGSVTSLGQPLVGCDMDIGLDALALAGAQFTALGHIHCPQEWTNNGAPVAYAGSPRRTAFGEVEDKSYILAELDGTGCTWSRVIIPATPMLLVDAEWLDGALVITSKAFPLETVRGAEVRLRYYVASDARDAARRDAAQLRDQMLADGAASIKLEEVVATTVRARSPEIAAAKTTADKVRALWASRGQVPDSVRATRLLTKLHELEDGHVV